MHPQTAVGADSQAEYEDDFEEDSGGGYRSIHFFSIILVLVIFTVVAYFCVHHKKKVRVMACYILSENTLQIHSTFKTY